MSDRYESLRDQIATLIQVGRNSPKSSDEIAGEVCKLLATPRDGSRLSKATVHIIQQAVALHFDLPMRAMTSPIRTNRYAQARQIGMYLSREMTKHTMEDVGVWFGGRDHGTVQYAIKAVDDRVATDRVFAEEVETIRNEVKRVLASENLMEAAA